VVGGLGNRTLRDSQSEYAAMNMLDLTKHHMDAASVLSWLLNRWETHPNAMLLVITEADDGAALINRVRVRLSNARKTLKEQGVTAQQEFTILSTQFHWTTPRDGDFCAVCFTKKVRMSHRMRMAVHDLFKEMEDGF
jgi:hypothetical protein